MTHANSTRQFNGSALWTRMSIGATIGLILIGFFLLNAGEPNPEWPSYWRIRPLIIVPLAGATGGAFFYFMHHIFAPVGWRKIAVNLFCALVFLVGLWFGTVLGLVGTYWH
jgi:hypothetical protein